MKYVYFGLIGLIATAAVGLTVLFAPPAQAHVLVVDTTDSKGAILHINPNDNPVAGQKSAIIFDTDNDVLDKNSRVLLSIKSDDGAVDEIEAEIEGPLAVAEYTFPARGVYQLSFAVSTGDETMTFIYSQRVSRGVATNQLDQPSYEWAKMLLLGTGIGIVILAILALNNRQLIKSQSSF